MREQVKKILINSDTDKACREMLKTAVVESESTLRKVITNTVTAVTEEVKQLSTMIDGSYTMVLVRACNDLITTTTATMFTQAE